MGKAAKMKQIRKLVKNLPYVPVNRVVYEKMKGIDLKEMGFETVGGKPIINHGTYKRRNVVTSDANHEKNMKNMYKKFGQVGVNGYLGEVQAYVDNQKKLSDANH